MTDLIVHRGRIATFDPAQPDVSALRIRDGKIAASGSDQDVLSQRESSTRIIDLQGHRVIPGLTDD